MAVLLLGADVAFYARHHTPVGAATWGSRFTTTPVILISMLAVPLLLAMRTQLSRLEKVAAIIVIALATIVQLLSVTSKMQVTGSGFVIGMRLVNLLATALDKFQDWHLATEGVEPRYLKLNFVPFLMDKYVSASLVDQMQLVWSVSLVLALANGGGVAEDWDKRRQLISSLAGRTARLVIKADLKDPMSGFFLMRRQTFEGVVRNLSQQGFKILLDLFASAPRPLRFAEVPYQFRPRTHGESKLDTMVAWEYGMLLADKMFGQFIPARSLLFGVIGALGLVVHMTVLAVALYGGLHLPVPKPSPFSRR